MTTLRIEMPDNAEDMAEVDGLTVTGSWTMMTSASLAAWPRTCPGPVPRPCPGP